MPRPIVAIIGRPNVGKSSLFNRVIGKRKAVVDPTPGVTRDRIMAEAEWNRREFLLVDTGGIVPGTTDRMELSIAEQAQIAMDEASVILFLTDVQTGVTDLDQEVARRLHRGERPVVLVVNKVDASEWEADRLEFYALGLGDPVPVSAMTGRNVGDMLDELVKALPPEEREPGEAVESIAVAILGRPNVGKSSLVNALVGAPAVVVDAEPGTTRDSTDTPLDYGGRRYVLIDTAGLRRQKAVRRSEDAIEYYSTLRTIGAIERCQVAVVLIDAIEHLVKQDIDIIDQVIEAGKAIVLAANKWDLVPGKDTDTAGLFVRELWRRYPTSAWLPVTFISASTRQRVGRVLDEVRAAHEQWNRRIPTSELNGWLQELNRTKPPQSSKAGVPRLYYATQAAVRPPTFVFFANNPDYVSDQATRYIEHALRGTFSFPGTPIRLRFRKK